MTEELFFHGSKRRLIYNEWSHLINLIPSNYTNLTIVSLRREFSIIEISMTGLTKQILTGIYILM